MKTRDIVLYENIRVANYPAYIGVRIDVDGKIFGELPSARFCHRRNGYKRRYFDTANGELCYMDVHKNIQISLERATAIANKMWSVTNEVRFLDEETFVSNYGKE